MFRWEKIEKTCTCAPLSLFAVFLWGDMRMLTTSDNDQNLSYSCMHRYFLYDEFQRPSKLIEIAGPCYQI